MHTENWSLAVSRPFITSPQAGRCARRNEECCTQSGRDHSLLLLGDADRSCSMFGRDFIVGGEDAADGGDVAESAPSRAASALNAFTLDSSFFCSFTGGVPVRLLPALSSRWASRLPPGPKFLRPLFVRPLRRLVGPKLPPGPDVWLGFLAVLLPSLRNSSVPTLLELWSGGGIWL